MKPGLYSRIAFFLMLGLSQSVIPARAEDSDTLFGTPVIENSGQILLDGKKLTLWGIEPLAADQQCWRKERAWACGEQASTSLKHYTSGKVLKCSLKSDDDSQPLAARCELQDDSEPADIARYLVAQGWARDNAEISEGLYSEDQEEARQTRKGIWTSRFQTADDWREGAQRFVKYKMEPEPDLPATQDSNINISNTLIAPLGPTQIFLQPSYPHAYSSGSVTLNQRKPRENVAPPTEKIDRIKQMIEQRNEKRLPAPGLASPDPNPNP